MTKWEYKITYLPRALDEGAQISDIELTFNEIIGKDGWELVAVDNGIAYFKRPVYKEFLGIGELIDATSPFEPQRLGVNPDDTP